VTEASEIREELRQRVASKLGAILPPKSADEAASLGSAGRSIIEPLAKFATREHRSVWKYCTAALIATFEEEALPALSRFAKLKSEEVDLLLIHGKRFFESKKYNKIVLSKCSQIRKLFVYDEHDLELLSALNSLEDVTFQRYEGVVLDICPKTSVRSMRILESPAFDALDWLIHFPALSSLEIEDCINLDDFDGIARCKELKSLKICSEKLFTADFVQGLTQLRTLDLSDCVNLEDVRSVNTLPRLSQVLLPFASLYEQVNQRLHREFDTVDPDVEDYFN
jgi:hypothetical protein